MVERGNRIPISTGTADFYFLCFVEIDFVACVGFPGMP
jgi:hypothetical protein